MGAEVSILDIDIVHRVSTRKESEGPKPVICFFSFYLFADDKNLLYADKNLKSVEETVNNKLVKSRIGSMQTS